MGRNAVRVVLAVAAVAATVGWSGVAFAAPSQGDGSGGSGVGLGACQGLQNAFAFADRDATDVYGEKELKCP